MADFLPVAGPGAVPAYLWGELLQKCLYACSEVQGEAFAAQPVGKQLAYATELYNLMAALSEACQITRAHGLYAFVRLVDEDLAELLRLFRGMGWFSFYKGPRHEQK